MIYKSPIRYVGNKYQLMPKILKHVPACPRMVDAFGGSAVVTMNMPHRFRLYNELSVNVFNYVDALSSSPYADTMARVQKIIRQYGLSSTNKAGFLKLREDANKSRDPIMFYTLSRHAFSSMSRFGKDGTFNTSFGYGKLNLYTLREELGLFYKRMQGVRKTNLSYTDLLHKLRASNALNSGTFIYLDPPYLATGRMQFYGDCWGADEDKRLMRNLDHLTGLGVKWMMSNALALKGVENTKLRKWSSKYSVIPIDAKYILSRTTNQAPEEVLIINY